MLAVVVARIFRPSISQGIGYFLFAISVVLCVLGRSILSIWVEAISPYSSFARRKHRTALNDCHLLGTLMIAQDADAYDRHGDENGAEQKTRVGDRFMPLHVAIVRYVLAQQTCNCSHLLRSRNTKQPQTLLERGAHGVGHGHFVRSIGCAIHDVHLRIPAVEGSGELDEKIGDEMRLPHLRRARCYFGET